MKKIIVGLTIIAMAALSLSADIYIKSKSHTDAMSIMGQDTPASDTVSEAWISDNVFANRTGDNGIIIDAAKEMAKIKGYQIASETSGEIMGAKMRSTTEVVEISKKSAPAGTYAVPAGFKKTDFINMADIQR